MVCLTNLLSGTMVFLYDSQGELREKHQFALPLLTITISENDMKINFKHIMEICGMVGFLEAKLQKSPQRPNESIKSYESRLYHELNILKRNVKEGMKLSLIHI